MRQRQMVACGHLAFARDDIERKVLHRGVEDFLDRARQAVDLIDKQNVAGI